jgi:hypothetical protein
MSSLTADILSKSLLELLEMSESNGPGLISIPDIINKMQRTMKKLRHLRTKMLLLVFTCNLCISGQQSDLFTLLVFFLTFSFLHLNIQSIVSKIDMISAEYSCHDILSFTESWLNENTSTDQQCFRMFNISPGLQITSWWDIECAVQVFFII